MVKDRDFQDYMNTISLTHARDVLIEKIAAVLLLYACFLLYVLIECFDKF